MIISKKLFAGLSLCLCCSAVSFAVEQNLLPDDNFNMGAAHERVSLIAAYLEDTNSGPRLTMESGTGEVMLSMLFPTGANFTNVREEMQNALADPQVGRLMRCIVAQITGIAEDSLLPNNQYN
jgi:hypothetical protein